MKLISTSGDGQGIDRERFAALLKPTDFEGLEYVLDVPPAWREGFRASITQYLWVFYRNSLPKAKIKVSRAVLVKELRTAAKLADKLAVSAERIWASKDRAALNLLSEFLKVSLPSQSKRPMH